MQRLGACRGEQRNHVQPLGEDEEGHGLLEDRLCHRQPEILGNKKLGMAEKD